MDLQKGQRWPLMGSQWEHKNNSDGKRQHLLITYNVSDSI